MAEFKLLKNKLGIEEVQLLAELINSVWSEFKQQQFIDSTVSELVNLELKERVNFLIGRLALFLPENFEQAADILIATGTQVEPDSTTGWTEFIAWPLIDYAGQYGQQNLSKTMAVFEALTALFTAEFAIRPFIENQMDKVYPYLKRWVHSDDEHLRRLASEATRPRLPWGGHLKQLQHDPSPIFPLLDALKDDKSLYVRKSVANNLNDISKDHPEVVIAICRRWQKDASKQRQWIIQRALRTLVKQGHPDVFSILGFSEKLELEPIQLKLDKTVLNLGDELVLSIELISSVSFSQSLVVDYCIHYMKSNGKRGPKVYKWKNVVLEGKAHRQMSKRQMVKPLSTRNFYSGCHTIELLINGVVYASTDFELIV